MTLTLVKHTCRFLNGAWFLLGLHVNLKNKGMGISECWIRNVNSIVNGGKLNYIKACWDLILIATNEIQGIIKQATKVTTK